MLRSSRWLDDRVRADGGSTYAPPPHVSRPGADDAQAIGLAAAVDYIEDLGIERIHAHELALTERLLAGWQHARGDVIGPTDLQDRGGTVAFVVDGVHAHDVGQVLDDAGVAVRVGHHCAWPLHRRFKVAATTRASFAAYTAVDEVDALLDALDSVPQIFGVAS